MEDKQLKEAIEECSKIIEEKCGKRPFMLVVSKANVRFENARDKEKGILKGTASYMYLAKPSLKRDGLSKLLIDTSKVAINQAEKDIQQEEAP